MSKFAKFIVTHLLNAESSLNGSQIFMHEEEKKKPRKEEAEKK
jgi:hypothetical protein